MPTGIGAATLSFAGSIRETVPSWLLTTQTDSPPTVTPLGFVPTTIRSTTLRFCGSMRRSVAFTESVTQTASAPVATPAGRPEIGTCAATCPLLSTRPTAFAAIVLSAEPLPVRKIASRPPTSTATATAPTTSQRRLVFAFGAVAGVGTGGNGSSGTTSLTLTRSAIPLSRSALRGRYCRPSTLRARCATPSLASTWPGAAIEQRRAARLSAPPRYPPPGSGTASPASSPMPTPSGNSMRQRRCTSTAARRACRAEAKTTSASSPRSSIRSPSYSATTRPTMSANDGGELSRSFVAVLLREARVTADVGDQERADDRGQPGLALPSIASFFAAVDVSV